MKALISLGKVASFIALMSTLALISTPPAHAQSASASAGPDDSQYVDCSSGAAAEGCSAAATIEDGVEAMGETASQGTAAINDAIESPTTGALASSPPSPGSASTSAAPAVSRETASSDDSTNKNEGTPGIEVLPETGGPSPAMLLVGVLLAALGLTARRVSGR